jgi:hypothetical protein
MTWILTFAIGIACIALLLGLVTAWERRRAALLRRAGTALGFRTYFEGESLSVPSVPIMRKRGRFMGATLEGEWQGEHVMVFDLSYPSGKGVSQTTVFMLWLREPRMSEFAAIRRNVWLYSPSLDLPRVDDPPPSTRWHWFLHAPDAKWPFGEATTEWLNRNSAWSVEGNHSALFVYRREKRASTKALEAWLDEAMAEARAFLDCAPPADREPIVDEAFSFDVSFRV